MAVSGVTGGSSIYGNRNVLSGLASGMDTESMIQNMTQATRLKIAQQNQKKTMLGWKQTAYQGISTQLIDFSKKYMDYQSPTNLLSSAFFNQSIVTSIGKNNGLVSATGSTNSKVEINGVKELATSANHSAAGKLQTQDLSTSEFDITGEMTHSKLGGETLTFTYGTKEFQIVLDENADLSTPDKVVEEINKQLADTKISTGTDSTKLGDKVEAKFENGQIKFQTKAGADIAGNAVKLTGASSEIKSAFNLKEKDLKDGIDLTVNGGFSSVINTDKLKEKQKTTEYLTDKKIKFSFNGQEKEITLLTKDEAAGIKSAKDFQNLLQKKFDDAFGQNKVEIQFKESTTGSQKGSFTFKVNDSNDILKVGKGSPGVVGPNSVFGFKEGDGNRLNLNATLEDLGIQFNEADANGIIKDKRDLIINGIKVGSYGKDAKLGDIIRDINANKELGVEASYSETSNKFVLTSKNTGAGSKIEIKEGGNRGENGLAAELFGKTKDGGERGTDAVIDVTINGERKQLTRSSNEIDIDGLKVTVSGKFGKYDDKGKLTVEKDETVTFTSKPDTEKVFDAIKTMVEDYNKIVDSVYKELTTKPNRDYKPLTDEQKKEMTEEQIEKWEEKAKEGILFGDTQLRSLHDSLRFVFNPGGAAGQKLREMGISPTDDYKDGGKIKLDEAKLKAALEANPDEVRDAFNALASDDANGDIMNSVSKGGVMTQLKSVTDRFASTSMTKPGILVSHAGSPSSPTSMMKNAIQKEMDSIDKILKSLDTRLKKEVDRYNSQFTQLEMLISQMNAQSGQLAGLMGGGMM